jgi:hypothetical protein
MTDHPRMTRRSVILPPASRHRIPLLAVLGFAACCAGACSDAPSGTAHGNLAPETHLALLPDSALRTTTSRQHIHWWGDDPDGFVAGYFFSFDGVSWAFTTKTDSIFSLTLRGTDTTYHFAVRAVDTQGNGVYDANGPYGAEPFTDANGNGRHDAGEAFTDFGLWDPTPATLGYPITNTPPVVAFVKGSEVPESTFTVASFTWVGTDLDGDESIAEYRYALNDTANAASWKRLPRGQTFLTLTAKDGIISGNNIFYLKAVDIAGAESRTIRMPAEGGTWHVRIPRTQLLIVDDYGPTDDTPAFYQGIVDTLLGGRYRGADVFDIKAGATSTSKGRFVPPFVNPTFTETLKLFTHVLWYCDNNPTIDVAQISLAPYQQSGGHVLYTASFPESALDPRGGITDYAPVDSLTPQSITFVPANTRLEAHAESPGYPVLTRDTKGTPVAFIRGLYRKINAANLYMLGTDPRWSGNPVIAVRSGDRRFVIFAVPLHRFDGAGNAGAVIRQVFEQEFGVR